MYVCRGSQRINESLWSRACVYDSDDDNYCRITWLPFLCEGQFPVYQAIPFVRTTNQESPRNLTH